MASPCSASSFGSTFSPSGPPRRTPSSQVRWLSPTWSRWTSEGFTSSSRANLRWKPIATLHRPTALCPAWSRARVTMPTGLVKSMIQASGLVRRTRSAMSRTTGTVRSALARPPAPVVSWPMQPHSSGQVSSLFRAACPPTRSWRRTASAPATPASRSVVVVIFPGVVLLGEDPPGQAADQFEPVGRRVDEHQLLDRQRVPQPGEAVDQFRGVGGPATNYCELHCQPFTPVSVTPSTNAF
ncbi:hypothetical protein SMICM304S_01349 [Streptomyces microflavus]